MKPEIKQKWIDALRSGEYDQGKGCLRDTFNNFCCLGVLCDLYEKEHGTNHWRISSGFHKHQYEMGNEAEVPPRFVWEDWAGLSDPNPVIYEVTDRSSSLATLNDTGYTFVEIAGVIEAQL